MASLELKAKAEANAFLDGQLTQLFKRDLLSEKAITQLCEKVRP